MFILIDIFICCLNPEYKPTMHRCSHLVDCAPSLVKLGLVYISAQINISKAWVEMGDLLFLVTAMA
jgi:hypothetical protein